MLFRLVGGQTGFFLYFIALTYAPMTIVNVVLKTDAFFVFICAYFINGEKIVPIEVVGILVCFVTIYVISRNQ